MSVFTQLNKIIIVPFLQNKISNISKIRNVEISNLELSFNTLKMKLLLENQTFNINGNFSIFDQTFNGFYKINIQDISVFNYISDQKLRGDIKATGDIKFDKFLTLNFYAKKFEGVINGTFIKDKLHLAMSDINSIGLLNMLYYPEVFKSSVDLILDYDIFLKSGKSNIKMTNGKFFDNELSKIIKTLMKKDLTTEVYKVVTIKTNIDDKTLDSILYMKSKNSEIKSNKIHMNLDKEYMKALLNIKYYKYDLDLELEGKLSHPQIKINLGGLLNSFFK